VDPVQQSVIPGWVVPFCAEILRSLTSLWSVIPSLSTFPQDLGSLSISYALVRVTGKKGQVTPLLSSIIQLENGVSTFFTIVTSTHSYVFLAVFKGDAYMVDDQAQLLANLEDVLPCSRTFVPLC
jgi:hypothetical protein